MLLLPRLALSSGLSLAWVGFVDFPCTLLAFSYWSIFGGLVVVELTFDVHDYASLFLFKELHGHGLSPIHVLFQIINGFLVLHFWAESFLSAVYAVCSVLLLVGPHVFNSHV